MKLNLKRPIIFFDLETTGIDTAKDRIVEISMVKVMPDGEEITKTRRINPEMHIPAEATAVHGITDEDVKDCPTFAQVAKSLEQFVRGCDFGGFNSNRFDLPVLVEEHGAGHRLLGVGQRDDLVQLRRTAHLDRFQVDVPCRDPLEHGDPDGGGGAGRFDPRRRLQARL